MHGEDMSEGLMSKISAPVSVFGVIVFGGALSGVDCTLTFFAAIIAGFVILAVQLRNERETRTES